MSLSIEKTNLLIQYLKENKDIFEVLFFGVVNESFRVKPSLYFKNYHGLMYQSHWLFENWCSNTKPTGLRDSDSVVFMEEDGVLVEYCKGLQNLPYVLLAIRTLNDPREIEDYSRYTKEEFGNSYEYYLLKYENWCIQNEIVINKDFGENFIGNGIGQDREVNPYYISPDDLVFDESESAKDISVKTLTALEIAK